MRERRGWKLAAHHFAPLWGNQLEEKLANTFHNLELFKRGFEKQQFICLNINFMKLFKNCTNYVASHQNSLCWSTNQIKSWQILTDQYSVDLKIPKEHQLPHEHGFGPRPLVLLMNGATALRALAQWAIHALIAHNCQSSTMLQLTLFSTIS